MAQDVNQGEKEVAAQVRSALVNKISSERYDLWIPADTQWDWNSELLSLKFTSDFSCQLAKKMLTAEIIQTLASVLGKPAQVIFETFETPTGSGTTASSGQAARAPRKVRLAPESVAHEEPNDEPNSNPAKRDVDLWEQFIPGTANQLAWTTAGLIVSEPGRLSPVLLHGPTGSGKSMLASAIAQRLRSSRRLRRVVHMTSEQFTNDFTEGLRGGGLPMFRRKYRDVDALVLDDLQFFVGKKSTLGEVRHTIDNLLRLGKQVVVTADRPLTELNQLGSELTGRLRGGMTAPLFPLDEQVRCCLLKRQLAAAGLDVDGKLVEQLAARVCGDGRVLSGVVNRLIAVAATHAGKLNWDACWNAVFDLVQATQPIVRLGDIERAVCSMFGLEPDSLQSQAKTRNVSQPRMLAMFLARKYTPAAYKEIGHYFGHRRHSTVISAEKTVTGWLQDNASMSLGHGLSIRDAIRHVESQLQVG